MKPVHLDVLEAALGLTSERRSWTFRPLDVVRALPHLNAGTVRTHVSSRCCVNAPSHHQTRYPYFRAIGRGSYRIEPAFRRPAARRAPRRTWQDRLLSALDAGIDATLIAESLKLTPTERLELMQQAAESLDAMTAR